MSSTSAGNFVAVDTSYKALKWQICKYEQRIGCFLLRQSQMHFST